MFEVIFSPTGGTKKVADSLCSGIGGESKIIDLTDRAMDESQQEFTPHDVCLIAVPSYGGRVPTIAAERILRMKGNEAKTILVVVIGNRAYDDTLLELKDVTEEAGFSPIAAVAANAEHSIMHQFGAGRPDSNDLAELNDFAKKIASLLDNAQYGELTVPGNRPYKEYNGLPMKPEASGKCNKCQKCADVCPVGAISKEAPDKTDKSKCITCMRCVAVCPRQARSLNKVILCGAAMAMKKACSSRKQNELYLAKQTIQF